MSIEVTTKIVCDVTGEDMGDVGWAIVRRNDGVEVAHFASLNHLVQKDRSRKLFDAAWKGSKETPAAWKGSKETPYPEDHE